MQGMAAPKRSDSPSDPGPEDISSSTPSTDSAAKQLQNKRTIRTAGASREKFRIDGIPEDLVYALRSTRHRAVRRITTQVQLEVAAYAGPYGGKRHRLVLSTVDLAVKHFVDAAEGDPPSGEPVYVRLRQLGQAEAIEGHSLDALRLAHHVATRVAWEELRNLARDPHIDPAAVGTLVDAVFVFIEQLVHQANVGFTAATQSMEKGGQQARRQLLNSMIAGHPPERYRQHLQAAGWDPPDEIVVITAVLSLSLDYATLPQVGPEALSAVSRHRMTLVSHPRHATRLSRLLINTPGIDPVAISWVVPTSEIRDAYRWAFRALDLADRGVIRSHGVIDCAQYRSVLWLHADPVLSRHAGEELLTPLMGEKSHHRLVLAETLLLWLQVRESAPALGERMQIHRNTVRRRLGQLKELFGDQLSDPEKTLALLSALEVAVPMWREQLQPSTKKEAE